MRRFSITLHSGNILLRSGQSIIPSLARLLGLRSVMSRPKNRTCPKTVILSPPAMCSFFLISSMIPEIVYMSVDLPALLAPNTPTICLSSHLILTLLRASIFS